MIVSQHNKTVAGDHGLKRDGDTIVIWRSFRPKPRRAVAGEQVSGQNVPLHCLIRRG
jgi:hypothetical protein